MRDDATLSVDKAVVTARWKEGWLRPGAGVAFSGTVGAPSTLAVSLKPLDRPAVVTARQEFDVAQTGPFTETLKLPARPLPGDYRLRVSGVSGATSLAPVDLTVTISAPPEGVIDRALVGPTRNGPWSRYGNNSAPVVTGEHKEIWMRFRFLYPPNGKNVVLVWKQAWRKVVGRIYRRYANIIDTYARSSSPLPKGHWNVVLTIDGRIAKQMDVLLR